MFRTFQIAVGGFDSNFSYLIVNEGESAVVDPCGDVQKLFAAWISAGKPVPKYILVTHAHPDHVDGLGELLKFYSAVVCVAFNSDFPHDEVLEDNRKLPLGDGFIECLSTPGHARDAMCFRLSDNSALFTGDTLFIGYCGFCRPAPMFDSLRRIKKLSGKLEIYPGHDYGDVPHETLEKQKQRNPYLIPEDLKTFRAALRTLV